MGYLNNLTEKGEDQTKAGIGKEAKATPRSQDPRTLGDFGGLDKFLLRVLTRFRSGPVFVQSHLELRVALSDVGVLGNCLCSTGECPASFCQIPGATFLCLRPPLGQE